ncbi:4032_t:CDS:2 [Cetraspora pellucida]|uniref:4032_t:CDS:1 n=1 Tax=Cetraspora pellucida TaxID=1433469 RepID=A0A9N9EH19_9GLOM|nr:4032_t:CDS:2 [Cetraspora pellucida]
MHSKKLLNRLEPVKKINKVDEEIYESNKNMIDINNKVVKKTNEVAKDEI